MAIRCIVPIVAIFFVVTAFAIAPALASSFGDHTNLNFPLSDLSGGVHSLNDYRGKTVVVNFFDVNCRYCQISVKNTLIPLYDRYYSDNPRVQFLSVETSGASAATTNTAFAQTIGVPWPVLVGAGKVLSADSSGVPGVWVIDADGNLAAVMTYPLNVQTLKANIDAVSAATSTPLPTSELSDANLATPAQSASNALPNAPTLAKAILDAEIVTPTAPASNAPKQMTDSQPQSVPSASSEEQSRQSTEQKAGQTTLEQWVARSTTETIAAVNANSAPVSSKQLRSSDATSTSASSVSIRLGTSSDRSDANNCIAPLTMSKDLCGASHMWLICAPSAMAPLTSSTVLPAASVISAEASALSQSGATSASSGAQTASCAIPNVSMPPAQPNSAASLPTQSVFEFSLLGLGIPMLLAAALYLLIRRI
jgi:peroxiredoxin